MERSALLTLVGPFIKSCGADVILSLALLRIQHQDERFICLYNDLPRNTAWIDCFRVFDCKKKCIRTWFDAESHVLRLLLAFTLHMARRNL